MTIEHIVEQGSQEWLDLRAGAITSSAITPVMAIKGLGKGADTLAKEKAWEKLMGYEDSGMSTFDMQRGNELEPHAFEKVAFDLAKDFKSIRTCGFFFNEELKTGSSPDGIISDNGGWENKAPRWAKFLDIVMDSKFTPETQYFNQMQHQMLVCGFDYVLHTNYIIYKGKEYIHYYRVERCERTINLMKERIIMFNALVEMYYQKLKALEL